MRCVWSGRRPFAWLVVIGLCCGVSNARAQQAVERPRIYLSCPQQCFDPYLRQELSYFDWVRDPHLADVNLVVVRQPAGNGGERFTVTPSVRGGSGEIETRTAMSLVTVAGTSPDAARTQLIQLILRVLHRDLQGTTHADAFELRLPKRDGDRLSDLRDPWDYWVIAPELRGGGEGGSGYYFAELTAGLTVRRITDASKLRLRGSYTRDFSGYRLEDGSRIRGDIYSVDSRALYARSLGQHVSLGVVAVARVHQYENLARHVHGGPALEFNLFRYEHNAHKQLRFAYQVGAWSNGYFERTLRGRTSDLLAYHAVSVVTDINQAWGSIQWVGQLNTFVPNLGGFRLSTGAAINLRLFEGFSLGVEGLAAWVRDQISLRERPVTDSELLLWTAQQPTSHSFGATFVATYTFGSVHNTIVNPRFGRMDLEQE